MNQLKKGMKKLFEQQHHLANKVVRLEDDMISLAHVAIEGLQHLQGELIRQGRPVIRYMEQDCMCPNHVQCDIVPLSLTSEVVLPSYQHYLEREHHIKGAKINESKILNQYGKTILMLILARVKGYYSLYSVQSITEEEERCFFGNVFTYAEKEFFKHRLQSKFHKMTKESIDTALIFLEKQKISNCLCQVHTESRGHDWVIFGRQPDRTPTLYYDVEQTESENGDNEGDDYYFSVEPVNMDEDGEEDQTNCEMNPDVTGAASSAKKTLP